MDSRRRRRGQLVHQLCSGTAPDGVRWPEQVSTDSVGTPLFAGEQVAHFATGSVGHWHLQLTRDSPPPTLSLGTAPVDGTSAR